MSGDSEEECPECPKGIPAWVMTFADLMSLLMCFFVLLLAFSEMDIQKYKQLAGSMKFAFGVQNKIDSKDIPRGTSIIAQEFSPGRPDPTPVVTVQQQTSDITKSTLDIQCENNNEALNNQQNIAEEDLKEAAKGQLEEALQVSRSIAKKIAMTLEEPIKSGHIEIETRGRKIVIRVKERGSFPSGSATLRKEFVPVMEKIRTALSEISGKFSIEGHSDDIPINTPRFRSNWDLSSARAVSVAHELFTAGVLDEARFTVMGYADTRPLVPNIDWRSRAKNRRVEITVEQGEESPPDTDTLDTNSIEGPNLDKLVEELESREQPVKFELESDELF